MGVLQLLDELPEAITRPPSLLWSVLARSLGEQGGAGRTALALRGAATGARPAPPPAPRWRGWGPPRAPPRPRSPAPRPPPPRRAAPGGWRGPGPPPSWPA